MESATQHERKRAMGIALIVIGIACAFYGMTVMLVGSGSKFFAFWYVLAAALIIWGWTLASGAWERSPIALRRIVEIAAVLFLAFLVVTQAMVASRLNSKAEPDLDYLIVLGAQVRPSGPSVALTSRLDTAYAYLIDNENTKVIVSGGQGPNEPMAEADAMAAYLVERGIDPTRIILEDQSLNTTQNLQNSLRLIDPAKDRIAVVTNSYHVFRGMAIARKQGAEHVEGISAGATPWYLPNNMTRESFGILKDFVLGNL